MKSIYDITTREVEFGIWTYKNDPGVSCKSPWLRLLSYGRYIMEKNAWSINQLPTTVDDLVNNITLLTASDAPLLAVALERFTSEDKISLKRAMWGILSLCDGHFINYARPCEYDAHVGKLINKCLEAVEKIRNEVNDKLYLQVDSWKIFKSEKEKRDLTRNYQIMSLLSAANDDERKLIILTLKFCRESMSSGKSLQALISREKINAADSAVIMKVSQVLASIAA